MGLKKTEYEKLLSKRVYLLSYIEVFFQRCIVLDETNVHKKTNFVRIGCSVLFLLSIFRLYPGLKSSFEHNSVRKNLILSACFCWDTRHSSREMDQKFKVGGIIGYGDSILEFSFRHFKVFRLHAILHVPAATV